MTEPTYTDKDLAEAEAEVAEASDDPGPDVPDTEAEEMIGIEAPADGTTVEITGSDDPDAPEAPAAES